MPARAVLLLVLCLGLGGCGGSDGGYEVVDESLVAVPDLRRGDGAKAVSAVEAAGFEARLADAGDDFEFNPGRDATGCEVTQQRPIAGERVHKGDRVTITVDCRQADWKAREGADWEAFADAYTAAFDDGCEALFEHASGASLSEGGRDYTATDCERLNTGDGADARTAPREVPDEPEAAGTAAGALAGCRALFDGDEVVALSDGAASIAAEDCRPARGGVRVREPARAPEPQVPSTVPAPGSPTTGPAPGNPSTVPAPANQGSAPELTP